MQRKAIIILRITNEKDVYNHEESRNAFNHHHVNRKRYVKEKSDE